METLASHFTENGLSIAAFAAAFVGGLLTALTPCVYPMIPITVGVMGARSARTRGESIVLSLTFVLGLSVVYSILGFFAASTGQLLGSLTQKPIVILLIGILFLGMGLSLLGLFEITLPYRFNQWLAKRGGNGFGGTFILGMVSGLLAAPCSGPLTVAILAFVAQRSTAVGGFLLLFTYSLGIGFPFFLIGSFSQLLNHMPKSGTWLNWTKKLSGIVLVVAAIWLSRPLFVHVPKNSSSNPVQISWLPSEEAGVRAAQASGKPVMVDFYADWCEACHELEALTFSNPEINNLIRNQFVAVRIDATEMTPDITSIIQKYGVPSLPTVIFLSPNGRRIHDLTVSTFVSAEEFLPMIKQAETRAHSCPIQAKSC